MMLFYKLNGMLDGYSFSQDDLHLRHQAAREFQGNQALFFKKLQEKYIFTICEIKSGRIILAAVSRESYNILARCVEFLKDVDVSVWV